MVSLTTIFVEYITFKCDDINGTPLEDGRAEIRSKEVQIIAALKIEKVSQGNLCNEVCSSYGYDTP